MDDTNVSFAKMAEIRAHLKEADRFMSLLSANGEPLLVIANARTELHLADSALEILIGNKSDGKEKQTDG